MGVLTLLALVGVGVLANVRTQRTRVGRIRVGVTPAKLMDGVQQSVLERLRADLWGEPSAPGGYLTGSSTVAPGGARESNEPFDSPGPFDRWLASTVPYRVDPDPNPLVVNDDYLVWYRVSYLGGDVVSNGAGAGSNRFRWAIDARTGAAMPATPIYADASLQNVAIRNTPPDYTLFIDPFIAASGFVVRPTFIPGSTTNVTIADARLVWQRTPQGVGAAFPYFDTNMDGEVDLYDADGDGVPDSPISFALPYSGTKNDEPREVYAVIRIVDNSSMLNLSTAGVRDSDGDGSDAAFDSGDLFYLNTTDPDRQFRGRRAWEVCVDSPPVTIALGANLSPILDNDRGLTLGGLINYRFTGDLSTTPMFGANNFYSDVIRRLLVGGANRSGDNYGRFRAADELALHNRNGLCNYVGGGTGARTDLENVLRDTLGTNIGPPHQWVRFVVDPTNPVFGPYGPSGYIAMLDTEDVVNRAATFGADIPALRRPLLTTISRVCDRMPDPSATTTINGLVSSGEPIQVRPMPYGPSGNATPEKIDLNTPVNEAVAAARAEYLGWLIWAFDRSGTASDGLQVLSDPTATGSLTAVPRVRLAAQLAANVVDYRDSDDIPTVIEDAGGANPIVGLERQPFLNEAYSDIKKTNVGGTIIISREYAIEVLNPYPYDMVGYKLKAGPNASIALDTIPAATPNSFGRLVPGRLTVMSNQWGATQIVGLSGSLRPTVGVQDNLVANTLELSNQGSDIPYRIWLLRPQVVVGGIQVDWPCDTFDLAAPWAVEGGAWQQTPDPTVDGQVFENWNTFQREEIDSTNDPSKITWKFSVSRSKYGDTAISHSLTEPNRLGGVPIAIGSIEPNVWTFRNVGLTPSSAAIRAFDTPIELSRVLAYGNELAVANPTDTSQWRTVPELLAKTQFAPPPLGVAAVDYRRTVGRLDFADLGLAPNLPKTGRVLHYLTCTGGQFDIDCLNWTCNPVDNDGDGVANISDPGEFARVAFRQAGLINVNTAPAAVLRAVPWMARLGAGEQWDLGPAIVSLREKRQVQSIFGYPADLTGNPRAGMPFITAADVIHASSAPAEFDVARFVQPGIPPVDNGLAPDASPDFDRNADGAAAASADLRARDLVLARWGNVLTTRSDVFTVYIALIDENGRYLRRSRFVVDRSNTAVEDLVSGRPTLPTVIGRSDSDYYDDMR